MASIVLPIVRQSIGLINPCQIPGSSMSTAGSAASVGHSFSGFQRKPQASSRLLAAWRLSTFTPLEVSAAGCSLRQTYLQWEVSACSLMGAVPFPCVGCVLALMCYQSKLWSCPLLTSILLSSWCEFALQDKQQRDPSTALLAISGVITIHNDWRVNCNNNNIFHWSRTFSAHWFRVY